MERVFLLNADLRHGLTAIRCLGLHGISVTAGSSKRCYAGRASKYTDQAVTYPPAGEDPDGFVRAVERELRRNEYEMVLPIVEETVEIAIRNRDRLERHAILPFPSYELLQVGLNKRRTIEAAREYDIPHPETLFSEETDLDTAEEVLGFPVVIKPQRGEGGVGVSVCHSRAELEQAVERTREEHGPMLFQEFIPLDSERGVYTLYGKPGELTALTVQQRLRSNPPEGGASTYRETVSDPELVELADRFLTALDWQGVAMVEFRVDARSREPKLLEVNPRLWGSLSLSAHAGVNFPYLLYRWAIGDDLEPNLEYEVGVRARYLFGDARHLLARDDRLRALCEFFVPSQRSTCYDIVSARDPLPTFAHLLREVDTLRSRTQSTVFPPTDDWAFRRNGGSKRPIER